MLSTYNRKTRKKTAALENCMNAVGVDKLNGVSEHGFTLPLNDPKIMKCGKMQYVRWDAGQLYRILDAQDDRPETGRDTISFSCEHVIATLVDDVIFGVLQLDNLDTRAVIERILSYQETPNWVLGECDFSHKFSYLWSAENLLVALFSVPNRFDEHYRWIFDTSSYPWVIHLKRFSPDAKPDYYIRRGKNLLSASKLSKARDICTRLYALGYGEGVNQLTIKDVNGGVPYIDASPEVIEEYGIVKRIWTDRRFENPQALIDRAKVLLKAYSEPYESYSVRVADIEKITWEAFDTAEVGKIVDWDGYRTYITKVTRHLQEVGQDVIELANKPEDIATSIADLADRQRINAVYANGATNIYAQSFNDNADSAHPAVIKFWVPSEARQINKVMLTWDLERYRAYETGAKAGGGATTGASSSSTTAGGGGSSTTSGPSSQNTTGGANGEFDNVMLVFTGEPFPDNGRDHVHSVEISMENHNHDMNHTHRTTAPSHNHGMDHTHKTPEHTHDITYGIYEGPRATSVTLRVDGANVPLSSGQKELDLASKLGVDGGGKIRRGTFHTIEIIPNSLTRISATIAVQLFVQSEGGGLY